MQNAIAELSNIFFSRVVLTWATASLAIGLSVVGCIPAGKTADLGRARDALNAHDYPAARDAADALLATRPPQHTAAEATYIKGRAIEDQPAADDKEAAANLQQARTAYISALKLAAGDKPLEGVIRAALADVAYWQKDFLTAQQQGTAAVGLLTDPTTRAWTLYRSGVAAKRLGQYEQADRAFAAVLLESAQSEPGRRAQERIGSKGMYVQVATFGQKPMADGVTQDLQQKQIPAATRTVSPTQIIIFAGPFKTFGEAEVAWKKLKPTYPAATIWP